MTKKCNFVKTLTNTNGEADVNSGRPKENPPHSSNSRAVYDSDQPYFSFCNDNDGGEMVMKISLMIRRIRLLMMKIKMLDMMMMMLLMKKLKFIKIIIPIIITRMVMVRDVGRRIGFNDVVMMMSICSLFFCQQFAFDYHQYCHLCFVYQI